jgi:hypothetical protein
MTVNAYNPTMFHVSGCKINYVAASGTLYQSDGLGAVHSVASGDVADLQAHGFGFVPVEELIRQATVSTVHGNG